MRVGPESNRDDSQPGLSWIGDRIEHIDDPLAREVIYTRMRARLFGDDLPPRTIGRFTIARVIGAGAMGTVYAAYDDQLDRGVAIKVIRRGPGSRSEQRLVREAQALAKLSHPNIVPVFEVGTHEGHVYMVMELVHGQSVRRWLEASDRSPTEILAVFEQAARGLSGAHAARIIHRDFKPDNVVVGDDGRVRVLDFGLAAADVQSVVDTGDDHVSASGDAVERHRSVLTESGALVGTPAYMAPEVFHGRESTAKSDQFGFCVALWEALFGERPFEGSTVSALMRSVTAGRLREPASNRGVPPRIKRVLLRGLATEPEQRFASMDALLVELAEPRRKRRWLVAGTAAAGIGSLWWWVTAPASPVCEGAEAALGPAWTTARQLEIERAFVDTQLPYAAATWERLQPVLDVYATEWIAMHRENCEATRRFGRQTVAMMEHRSACLADRRRSLDALTHVFAAADEEAVANAVAAATALPAIEPCRDERYVASRVPLPETPEARRRFEALQQRIALAEAENDAGHHGRARELLEALVEEVAESGDRLLLGRAKMALGAAQSDFGDARAIATLTEAYRLVLSVGDDRSAATIASTLVWALSWREDDFTAAQTWLVSATALTERSGNDPDQRATLAFHEGALRERAGDPEAAEEAFRRSLSLTTQTHGEDDYRVASDHSNLGSVLRVVGRYDEARTHLERAVVVWEKGLGPEHPEVADGLNNLAALEVDAARYDVAEPLLERAIAIWQRSAPDRLGIGFALQNLGIIHDMRGDYRKGESLFRESLEFRRRVLGPDHLDTAASLVNLGSSLYSQKRYPEAASALEEAIEIRTRKLAPDDARLVTPLVVLGDVQRAQGDLAAAEAAYERAGAIARERFGPEHPKVGEVERRMGQVWLARHDDRRAREHFERSLAILGAAMGPDHPTNLHAHDELARDALRRRDDAKAAEHIAAILRIVETQTIAPEDAAEALLLAARWRRGRGDPKPEIASLLDAAERRLTESEGSHAPLRAELAAERRALR